MKTIFSRFANLIILLLPGISFVQGQTVSAGSDKYTLLTEPFNKRPVTVHMGQVQLKAGYSFSVRTKSFGPDGSKIGLIEDGSASVIHAYRFNLRFGILEFLEAGAEMNYSMQGVRDKTENYFSGNDYITVNHLSEYKGFDDLRLFSAIRLPLKTDYFGFGIEGGISIPTSKYMPEKPTHTIESLGGLSALINYHYNNRNGTGVPVWNSSVYLKLILDKFSLYAFGSFQSPVKEGVSIRWDETLINQHFQYSSQNYSYLPSGFISYYISLHAQTTGWLDLFIAMDHTSSIGGWTEYYGLKLSNPEKKLTYIRPGIEIQVSPLVRLNEEAGFSVSGQNSDGPFYVLTSLVFNVIPFMK